MAADQPTVVLSKGSVSLLQAVAGPAPRRPCLILYSGADAGQPFHLDPGTVAIGRAPDCALLFDSPGISRHHAELQVDEHAVTLRDLGSINGTWVNEARIDTPLALKDGDLVRLGMLVFRFFERESLDAALHDRIYRLATVDSCTEVFNRRYLVDTLKREMRVARQHGRPLALLCFDLDHFKAVNDRWGHTAGDVVLRDCAALLRAATPATGVVGRLGGEEFAVVLPGTELARAVELAEGARASVAEHRFVISVPGGTPGNALHRQTLSGGVASFDAQMNEVTDLLAAADRQLYASKNGGRNRITG